MSDSLFTQEANKRYAMFKNQCNVRDGIFHVNVTDFIKQQMSQYPSMQQSFTTQNASVLNQRAQKAGTCNVYTEDQIEKLKLKKGCSFLSFVPKITVDKKVQFADNYMLFAVYCDQPKQDV